MAINKEYNDIQLDVKFTQASTRANLVSEENISVSFGKISKYFADLHSQAFTGYSHPTHTVYSSGLYKITVDGLGHVTSATTVTGSDLPAHEHPYLPLAGGTLTGRVTTSKFLNYIVKGTGTAGADKGSGQNPRYVPAKWTFNTGQTASDGDVIIIKIPVAGHDYGVYISIDNGTTYHPVVISGSSRLTTHYGNGNYAVFTFRGDGSASSMIPLAGNTDGARVTVTGGVWQGVDYYDSGNTYDRTSQQTRIYAGGVGVFRYSICGLNSAQRMESFTTTGDASGSPTTTKTFNTSAKFSYPPVIMYNNANAAYSNGNVIGNNVLYEQFPSLDMRYSCNKTSSASTGFTQYKPVFIECTFDDNGFWSITSNGFVQTFTSGKYYILVGCMYNTSVYQLAMFAQHPVYYYDGTNLTMIPFTKAEKTKLAGISEGANKTEASSTNGKIKIDGTDTTVYTHPSYTSKTSGLYKITVDSTGHVSGTAAVTASDLPAHTHSDYVLKTGDTMSGNLTFAVTDDSDTPGIVFKRGNFTDSTLDWKIYNSSGALMMDRTVAGDTETWQNKFKVDGAGIWYGGTQVSLVGHTHSQYLPKTTYEWNKEISFGNSGYLKIGSFPMYDTNITIDINATTSKTYHGTVVIATQNVSTTSMGSQHIIHVYDDPTGNIAASLRIVWTSGSRNYDIYFIPQSWSKNFIHIRALGNYMDGATDICVSQTGTAPATTSGLEPVNILSVTSTGDGNAVTKVEIDSVGNLAVTKGSTFSTSDHAHGNITNGGALQTDITIASGDKLVVTDSSDSNKVARASISFDGSTTTKCLTQKGTWETFLASHPTITKSADTTSTASPAHGGTFTVVDSVTREANGHVTKINTKTVTLPADSNTDTKVTQSSSTTSDFRPLLLGKNNQTNPENLETTVTDQTYVTKHVFVQPSTGNLTLYNASGDSPSLIFRRGTMIDNTLDWRIQNVGGKLNFDRDKNESTETWENIFQLDPTNNKMYFKNTEVSLSGHTHPLSITADSGTNQLTLSANTKYKLTAGGNTFVFTTPPDTTYSAGNHMSLSSTTFSIASYCKSITDWNSATTNGWYMGSSVTNAPSTAWWFGRVVAHNNKYCMQEVWQFTASTDGHKVPHKMRMFVNNVWGSWVDITVGTQVPENAVFTDTKVTSSANHYTPATASGEDISKSASDATEAWGIDVVKGITLNTDGKGHVTGMTVTSGKIPPNPVPSNNVTGSGTSGYLTKWNGTNTVTNGPQLGSSTTTFLRNDGTWATPPGTYTHPTYTRTDTTSTASPAHGGTFTAIDSVTSTNGHVTAVNVKTVTLPAQYIHPGKTQTDTTSTASPAHGGTFTVVDSVTRDTSGHVSGINVKTVTLPSDQNTDTKVKVTANTTTKGYLIASTTSPNGTAVEGIADTGVYLDTTAGTLCGTSLRASSTLCANTANSNSAGGIALYGTDPTAYGIMFRGTTNSGKHGYVQSDWATYFTMNEGGTTRGWVFRRGTTNVASISGAGNAVFNGSVTVGGNSTNTSGCRMEYNSTTQSLDFVFV